MECDDEGKGFGAGVNASPLSLFAMSEIFFPVFFILVNPVSKYQPILSRDSTGEIINNQSMYICFHIAKFVLYMTFISLSTHIKITLFKKRIKTAENLSNTSATWLTPWKSKLLPYAPKYSSDRLFLYI